MKAAWIFLCDKCDQAGVWSIDMDSMSFHVGEKITLKSLLDSFNSDKDGRITLLRKDLIFIPGFISFQYGTLSAECKPHKPIFALLDKHNLSKGYPKGIETLQEEEKEKEQEKDQEQEQETEKEKQVFDFENLYQSYPLKKGKAEGIARLKKTVTSQADFDSFKKAVSNYTRNIQTNGTEPKYIKHFSSFVGTDKIQPWKDWLDADAGTAIAVTPKPLFNKATQRTENNRAVAEAYMRKLEGEKV